MTRGESHRPDPTFDPLSLDNHVNDFCMFLSLPMALVDPAGCIRDANPHLTRLFEYERSELIGKHLLDLSVDKDGLKRILQATMDRDRVQNEPGRFRSRTGRILPVRISTITRRDAAGEIVGYYTVIMDMSDYEKAREDLQLSANDLNKHYLILNRILSTAESLLINLDIDQLLKQIVQSAHDALGFNIVLLNLIDRQTSEIRMVGHAGLEKHDQPTLDRATVKMTWKDFTGILDERYRIGRCYFIPHGTIDWTDRYDYHRASSPPSKTPAEKWDPEDALLALIEIAQGQVVGIISVDQPADGLRPTPETIQSLEIFANLAGVALENARVYEQLQRELEERRMAEQALRNVQNELERTVEERTAELTKTNEALKVEIIHRRRAEDELKLSFEKIQRLLDSTVRALSQALAKRDPYTAGHQQRVTSLACAIARELGLDPAVIDVLRFSGLIHDIGKISIAAEILNKPTRLDRLEMELMKTHPQVGYEILMNVDFPSPVADIVLQHHERLDGSGYPKGLKQPDILFETKILSVADVVEAMSSHRPYRPAHSLEKALEEIGRNRGTLYETTIVDTCINIFHEHKFQLNE